MFNEVAVAVWLAFASQYSGLPIPKNAPMPTVYIVPRLADTHDEGETDPRTGVVTILRRQRTEIEEDCLLAHELTHVLQVWNHVHYPCFDAVEPPAYIVEAACFRQFGKPYAADWALEQARLHSCRKR